MHVIHKKVLSSQIKLQQFTRRAVEFFPGSRVLSSYEILPLDSQTLNAPGTLFFTTKEKPARRRARRAPARAGRNVPPPSEMDF